MVVFMLMLMIEWAIAAIPAIVILGLIMGLAMAVVGGLSGGRYGGVGRVWSGTCGSTPAQ